jgi:hypothetical protein
MRRIGTTAALLVLLLVTSVAAQQVYTGTVMRIDPAAGVIVFEDGRMLQTTADTVIISGNQRMMLSWLQRGAGVTIYSAQPVTLRDGRYVLLSETGVRAATPGTVVVTPPVTAVVPAPPPPPSGVIVTSPSTTTVVTPGTAVATVPAFEVSGTVFRADEMGRVIHLTDGRKVHVTEETQVLLNGVQPVQLSTLKPGSHVVVRSVRPFAGSHGMWVPMTEVARGSVVRVDQPGVVVLSDGRVIQTTPETVVYVDRRPVAVSTIQPGTRIIIYQNGSTIAVVTDPAASPAMLVPEMGLREREMDRQGQ